MKTLCLSFLLLLSFSLNAQSPAFQLAFPGQDLIVDYDKYGQFWYEGTDSSKYVIKDKKGLSDAVGEGIFPNLSGHKSDSLFIHLKENGKLKGGHWEINSKGTPAEKFFAWANAAEEPGVKLFFTAEALVEAGLIKQAIKAYYALLVHFPRSACFSGDGSFVWYVGPQAIDRIIGLCRKHPELGVMLKGASIDLQNDRDTDLNNDKIRVSAGRLVKEKAKENKPMDLSKQAIAERRGKGKVSLVRYENGHWQLMKEGKSFIVKAVTYGPTKVGESPQNGTLRNWQFIDDNHNGKIDAPEESFEDKNGNNIQDNEEPAVGDFALLKRMGCNAIRDYHVSQGNVYNGDKEYNKRLLRDMYNKYGISVIMGDFLGAYTVGSGAKWEEGTDYTNKEQCERMKKIVHDWVMDNKDEPYVLMWLLGNENNMPAGEGGVNATATNASSKPEAYARFLNEVAKMIHELDPEHPVAIGNQEVHLMDYYEKFAPELDIIGVNAYRGKDGFGSLFEKNKKIFDRPVLITEYGCDAYNSKEGKEDEEAQAGYHKGNWEDISYNRPGGPGAGNCLGGVAFEYLDEWWKSNTGPADTHEVKHDSAMAFPDGSSQEEWFGLTAQGDGKRSPFLRRLRKAFQYYEKTWNIK